MAACGAGSVGAWRVWRVRALNESNIYEIPEQRRVRSVERRSMEGVEPKSVEPRSDAPTLPTLHGANHSATIGRGCCHSPFAGRLRSQPRLFLRRAGAAALHLWHASAGGPGQVG